MTKLRALKALGKRNYQAPILVNGIFTNPYYELDLPQTPELNERDIHIAKLEELAANFEEDEAKAVIYILTKKYPEVAFNALLKGYTELNDKVNFVNSVIDHTKGDR